MKMKLSQSDVGAVTALLTGRKVVGVYWPKLILDNGVELEVEGNSGGCSCGAGDYDLTVLHKYENVITGVRLEETGDQDRYSIFVYADGIPSTEIVRVEGDVGNGYYGWGYTLTVHLPSTPPE